MAAVELRFVGRAEQPRGEITIFRLASGSTIPSAAEVTRLYSAGVEGEGAEEIRGTKGERERGRAEDRDGNKEPSSEN